MKKIGLNEIRKVYLDFFAEKGAYVFKSAPLVPQGDNSILLINAGMTPLKKYFTGELKIEEQKYKNTAASCQKCIRTPDIENVGYTARHGTYFEMLGNFSFGSYFKKEAIKYAWEFLTKTLEIPTEKLYVTVFGGEKDLMPADTEALDFWVSETGIPRERIFELGKKDNFWEHGSGPCGPCSEIHFERFGGEPIKTVEDFEKASEQDRIVEIWNLVFTQFDSDGKGKYTPLKSKNIDTGMGLERLACVIQGADNLFEVDTVKHITDKVTQITGKTYKADKKDDVALRIITDHTRSCVFMIGDGIAPSNEGRGYILRRLLRRAVRYGRILGVTKPFMYKIADAVIGINKEAYPELCEKSEYIKKVMLVEEENFSKTIENGLEMLDVLLKDTKVLSGENVFKLHDTYGFPFDLTKEICSERCVTVDEDGFRELMKKQKLTAKASSNFHSGWDGKENGLKEFEKYKTEFFGYDNFETKATILTIVKNGENVNEINSGEESFVLIDKTPFYAESGGQTGDSGIISDTTIDDNILVVEDTKKLKTGQIYSLVRAKGNLKVGDKVNAKTNMQIRWATTRNHTAAHLLQAALRSVLGEHIHQAGSYVDDKKCRFDFTHFQALSSDELCKVESMVNDWIFSALSVTVNELPIDQAKKLGATALFGEKYGDMVRVVSIGNDTNFKNISVEFCGGTHLSNTSQAGLFKIVSESAAAAGVRRIEAVTGQGVLSLLGESNAFLSKISAIVKADINAIPEKIKNIIEENKSLKSEVEKIKADNATQALSSCLKKEKIKEFSFAYADLSEADIKELREISDTLSEDLVALFGKNNVIIKSKLKSLNAGKIVSEVAKICGGKGGGKPDSATGGIPSRENISDAIEFLRSL